MAEFGELLRQAGAWLDASGWGALVGFAGSIISIVGVPVAAVRARQARSAARAASEAASATRSRIALIDAVHSLSSLLGRLDEVQERIGGDNWAATSRTVGALRRELLAISAYDELLTHRQQSATRDMLTTLRELEALMRDSSVTSTAGLSADLRLRLLEQLDEMYLILASLRRRAVGS